MVFSPGTPSGRWCVVVDYNTNTVGGGERFSGNKKARRMAGFCVPGPGATLYVLGLATRLGGIDVPDDEQLLARLDQAELAAGDFLDRGGVFLQPARFLAQPSAPARGTPRAS
jgi:hypothetical protein